MIRINKLPILLHIMKIYINFGFDNFIIAAGYKKKYYRAIFQKFFQKMEKFLTKFYLKKNVSLILWILASHQ